MVGRRSLNGYLPPYSSPPPFGGGQSEVERARGESANCGDRVPRSDRRQPSDLSLGSPRRQPHDRRSFDSTLGYPGEGPCYTRVDMAVVGTTTQATLSCGCGYGGSRIVTEGPGTDPEHFDREMLAFVTAHALLTRLRGSLDHTLPCGVAAARWHQMPDGWAKCTYTCECFTLISFHSSMTRATFERGILAHEDLTHGLTTGLIVHSTPQDALIDELLPDPEEHDDDLFDSTLGYPGEGPGQRRPPRGRERKAEWVPVPGGDFKACASPAHCLISAHAHPRRADGKESAKIHNAARRILQEKIRKGTATRPPIVWERCTQPLETCSVLKEHAHTEKDIAAGPLSATQFAILQEDWRNDVKRAGYSSDVEMVELKDLLEGFNFELDVPPAPEIENQDEHKLNEPHQSLQQLHPEREVDGVDFDEKRLFRSVANIEGKYAARIVEILVRNPAYAAQLLESPTELILAVRQVREGIEAELMRAPIDEKVAVPPERAAPVEEVKQLPPPDDPYESSSDESEHPREEPPLLPPDEPHEAGGDEEGSGSDSDAESDVIPAVFVHPMPAEGAPLPNLPEAPPLLPAVALLGLARIGEPPSDSDDDEVELVDRNAPLEDPPVEFANESEDDEEIPPIVISHDVHQELGPFDAAIVRWQTLLTRGPAPPLPEVPPPPPRHLPPPADPHIRHCFEVAVGRILVSREVRLDPWREGTTHGYSGFGKKLGSFWDRVCYWFNQYDSRLSWDGTVPERVEVEEQAVRGTVGLTTRFAVWCEQVFLGSTVRVRDRVRTIGAPIGVTHNLGEYQHSFVGSYWPFYVQLAHRDRNFFGTRVLLSGNQINPALSNHIMVWLQNRFASSDGLPGEADHFFHIDNAQILANTILYTGNHLVNFSRHSVGGLRPSPIAEATFLHGRPLSSTRSGAPSTVR